jgi:diguanylate cyclase (GGDEF)-like protein
VTVVVVITGASSVLAVHLLVATYRSSAVNVEEEATASAQLNAEIVSTAIILASPISPAQQLKQTAAVDGIGAEFAKDISSVRITAAAGLLRQTQTGWQALLAATGPTSNPPSLTTRGIAVETQVPGILALLNQADAANRAGVRAALARADRTDREALIALTLIEVLAVLLAIRLARRLSSEVLRPVGILRDSANHLARGDFDHRIAVDRNDELGELATSFNAMADAIAGSQRSLSQEASTDSLTGLANRAAFYDQLRATLGSPRPVGDQALLFVDLDDFKDVNDTLGHAAGDELLRVVSARLVAAVRPVDVVARLGGDEFALLLEEVPDVAHALILAERIVVALDEAVQIGAQTVHVGASVGLAMRDDYSTIEGWVREADVAMYAAKARGKNRVERYNAMLDDAAVARQLLKDEVAVAAERGELVVEYQPVVDLQRGTLIGLEALVRWQHPTQGLLPPSAFIELAEESGAILSVGAWVFETAARQLSSWQRRYGRPDLWMSINVSVRQIEEPGYADKVQAVLAAIGLEPASIVIEVTESVLADPMGGSAAALTELRTRGIRVALDDFGTGYSSIGYLRQLPVDFLKIDRSFVAGTSPGAPGNSLLEAIVGMGQHLGLEIIPEGIEQPTELAELRSIGCRIGQGFLMSRPVSPGQIEAFLVVAVPFDSVVLAVPGIRQPVLSGSPA